MQKVHGECMTATVENNISREKFLLIVFERSINNAANYMRPMTLI